MSGRVREGDGGEAAPSPGTPEERAAAQALVDAAKRFNNAAERCGALGLSVDADVRIRAVSGAVPFPHLSAVVKRLGLGLG